MKEYTTDKIRNFCLAGQRGCGKTTLGDAIAYDAGVNNRIGKVDDGSSVLDYTDAEIARSTSLTSKLLAFEWKNHKINLFDCPGHSDFVGELLGAAHVTDAVGFLVDALAGVEIGTQLQWRYLDKNRKAIFFFVNKMDKDNADGAKALESIVNVFGKSAVAIQLPIGNAADFKGIVDLLTMKAYTFDDKGERKEIDIPADLKDQAEAAKETLIEAAAEADDALMEKFFDEGTLGHDDFMKGFSAGIANGKVFPVLFGAASKNMGVKVLLDFCIDFLPAANQVGELEANMTDKEDVIKLPFDPNGSVAAYACKVTSEGHLGDMTLFRVVSGTIKPGVDLMNQQTRSSERFTQLYTMQGKNRIDVSSAPAGDIVTVVKLKNTHVSQTVCDKAFSVTVPTVVYPNPVMDVAIRPKKKGDEDKISAGIHKINEEDPTFKFISDPALQQQVLYAQGSTHIDTICEKLKSRFGVEVELHRPKIAYRETIKGKTEKEYKHKKQSGGRGQYGHVHIRIEPNVRGGGFLFTDELKGGVIPSKFVPAVEKGVVESMVSGGLAGSEVVDVKVAVFYGSSHDVDSSDMAFKIAGMMAFKEGFMECKPILLEPIYNLEVLAPNDYTGDVMGDLSSRRAKIAGMDPEGANQRVKATVPQAELYQYSVDLRSMTQGQGVYSIEFSHYEEVPHEAAQKVIAAAKAEKEADA